MELLFFQHYFKHLWLI